MSDFKPYKFRINLGQGFQGKGTQFTVFYFKDDDKAPKLVSGPNKDRIKFTASAYQGKKEDGSYNDNFLLTGTAFSPAANGLAENVTHGQKINVTAGYIDVSVGTNGERRFELMVEDFNIEGNNTTNTPVTAGANKPVSQGLPPGVTY